MLALSNGGLGAPPSTFAHNAFLYFDSNAGIIKAAAQWDDSLSAFKAPSILSDTLIANSNISAASITACNIQANRFSSLSDRRAKTDIELIDKSAIRESLMKINVYKYKLNGSDRYEIGVIADEFESDSILELLLDQDAMGYKRVCYDRLSVLLTALL